ncbi:MAG: cyclic nucleotide-binding domain-containing protein [Desulfobacterales bacterium]|nr:cyclic nucleotide-binding domain-containing protein [Desulfobacterales bacterium]
MSFKELIAGLPMFEFFTDEELEAFSGIGHSLEEFHKGDVILGVGEGQPSLFLLVKGTVLITRTANNIKIRLSKLGPGELFGEMSFFTRKPRTSDVVANDDVTVIRMDDGFFEKVEPQIRDKIKNYFIEILIKRLDLMNEHIMKISRLMHS